MIVRCARRCAAAIVGAFMAANASAGIVDFQLITSNSSFDIGNQLEVALNPVSANRIEFRMSNTGPLASSMTAWYFEGASALFASIHGLDNSHPGVDFTVGGSPPSLPGGNTVGFVDDYRVTSTSPRSHNGVNPGEYLGIVFNLNPGVTLAQITDRIASGLLRMGMHIQALPDGESDSYVSVPNKVVPSPTAVSAGMLGMACVSMLRRRLV